MEDEVEAYMQPSAKAMKQEKNLLSSKHIHGVKSSIKLYFSVLSLIYVPMENKHVVLKQFII